MSTSGLYCRSPGKECPIPLAADKDCKMERKYGNIEPLLYCALRYLFALIQLFYIGEAR